MDIKRIDEYDDGRFAKDVLFQHGAFVVDGKYPCSFRIIGESSAVVEYYDYSSVLPIIDEFRFYTQHITDFYDDKNNLIAKFPPVLQKELPLTEIQPTQFYVDEDKLNAVSTFIHSGNDVIIPVLWDNRINKYISLDGHTRMYYAYLNGWNTIRAYESCSNDSIFGFVDEARNRGITKISDIKKLSHKEYDLCWNKFCDDFFAKKS